jgi:hypothetical protein
VPEVKVTWHVFDSVGGGMLSELRLLTLAQLEKAAIDSGFDVVGGPGNSLMSFRSS